MSSRRRKNRKANKRHKKQQTKEKSKEKLKIEKLKTPLEINSPLTHSMQALPLR
jgi:hypothetical protein